MGENDKKFRESVVNVILFSKKQSLNFNFSKQTGTS